MGKGREGEAEMELETDREKKDSIADMYTVYIVYTSSLTHCTCTMYMYL